MEPNDLKHSGKLSCWLFMKTGIAIKKGELYSQKKDIIQKLCKSLPSIPTTGTKASLISALKNHVFTDEQIDEIIKSYPMVFTLYNNELIKKLNEDPKFNFVDHFKPSAERLLGSYKYYLSG